MDCKDFNLRSIEYAVNSGKFGEGIILALKFLGIPIENGIFSESQTQLVLDKISALNQDIKSSLQECLGGAFLGLGAFGVSKALEVSQSVLEDCDFVSCLMESRTEVNLLEEGEVKREWFQSYSRVTLGLFEKNMSEESVKIKAHKDSLLILLKAPTWKIVYLHKLSNEIDPSGVSFTCFSTKVEVLIPKLEQGLKWHSLEGSRSALADKIIPLQKNTNFKDYPSSYKGKSDWAAIEKEEDETPVEEEAVNDLFMNIYKNADENTKRAMLKSYTESSGTCISTDWNEVSSKTVPVSPPDGTVAKSFD